MIRIVCSGMVSPPSRGNAPCYRQVPAGLQPARRRERRRSGRFAGCGVGCPGKGCGKKREGDEDCRDNGSGFDRHGAAPSMR